MSKLWEVEKKWEKINDKTLKDHKNMKEYHHHSQSAYYYYLV